MSRPDERPIMLRCDYCERQGPYPSVIHVNVHHRFACVDVAACDERDAQNARASGEEDQ